MTKSTKKELEKKILFMKFYNKAQSSVPMNTYLETFDIDEETAKTWMCEQSHREWLLHLKRKVDPISIEVLTINDWMKQRLWIVDDVFANGGI